jgi:hypothetical protein
MDRIELELLRRVQRELSVKEVRYIVTNADPVEPTAGCDVFQTGIEYSGDHIGYPAKSPARVGQKAIGGRFLTFDSALTESPALRFGVPVDIASR